MVVDNKILRESIRINQPELVKLLINKGADVTAQDNWAVLEASYSGYTDIVELLLANGAKLD